MSIIKITPNGICDDPNCFCDDAGGPKHERSLYVTLSMLHLLAEEAGLNLVFLPDGRVWVGGDHELRSLADQLEEEEESAVEGWRQEVAKNEAAKAEPDDFCSGSVWIEKDVRKMN